MGPSDKAFNQVKNILGKLDRSIDEVRNKRLTPEPTPVPVQSSSVVASPTTLIGVPKQAPAAAPAAASAPARSGFGRARPILPENGGGSALWKTT